MCPGLDYHENHVEQASCFMLSSRSNTGNATIYSFSLCFFLTLLRFKQFNIFLGVLRILASFIFLVIFQQKSSSWDLILYFFYTLSWIFNRAGTKCAVPVSSYVQFCPKPLDGNVANTFSTLLQII